MGKIGTPRYKDEVGNTYGKLTVIEFASTDKNTSYWKCSCECGGHIITRGNTLRSGQCKSCGSCDIQKPMPPDAPYKRAWRQLQQSAKQKGRDVELTYESFTELVNRNCEYCGQPPTDKHFAYSRRRSKGIEFDVFATFNGVDRVNSDEGYTLTNIRSCCNMCNRMKTDFDVGLFLNHVRKIYEHNSKIGID
jgi:hypothetical protein